MRGFNQSSVFAVLPSSHGSIEPCLSHLQMTPVGKATSATVLSSRTGIARPLSTPVTAVFVAVVEGPAPIPVESVGEPAGDMTGVGPQTTVIRRAVDNLRGKHAQSVFRHVCRGRGKPVARSPTRYRPELLGTVSPGVTAACPALIWRVAPRRNRRPPGDDKPAPTQWTVGNALTRATAPAVTTLVPTLSAMVGIGLRVHTRTCATD